MVEKDNKICFNHSDEWNIFFSSLIYFLDQYYMSFNKKA